MARTRRYRPEKYIEVHDTHHQDFVKLDLPPQFSDRAFINSCDGLIEIPKRLQQLSLPYTSKLVPAKSGILYMAIEPQLMAFDLHNEVFRLYAFPDFEHYVRSSVLDFEGSVAMIFQDSNGSALSLYRLDDVCEKGSWIKMFNLEADIKINWVVGYLGCGQFIARNYVEHCVFNYDYRKKGFQDHFIDGQLLRVQPAPNWYTMIVDSGFESDDEDDESDEIGVDANGQDANENVNDDLQNMHVYDNTDVGGSGMNDTTSDDEEKYRREYDGYSSSSDEDGRLKKRKK
ncbi:hypothetical protein POM88_023436 [Heracleum sosnowskyi]|uniref:F-box associated domain-containing protein n=1 Tax=Heracleum sosnowskyi TaxID=360622 RepID=A0AAD8IHN4_9APIA|nr:hypothetical protein POM88_023436 [Heracleum sosnowskyi]